ncbi:MAG TPA: protein TolA, partial [Burkholderiaceae bacterium]|nr:protein TolA [Burkholderiaceae bacterium]
MLSIAALLLHAAFLSELDWAWPQAQHQTAAAAPLHASAAPSVALETRTLAAEPSSLPTPPPPVAAEAAKA